MVSLHLFITVLRAGQREIFSPDMHTDAIIGTEEVTLSSSSFIRKQHRVCTYFQVERATQRHCSFVRDPLVEILNRLVTDKSKERNGI